MPVDQIEVCVKCRNFQSKIFAQQTFFSPKDVSSQSFSKDCWRISINSIRIPPICMPSCVSHLSTYPFNTYPFNRYPFKKSASAKNGKVYEFQNIHQLSLRDASSYVSISCVSIQNLSIVRILQKVCISRNDNVYECKTFIRRIHAIRKFVCIHSMCIHSNVSIQYVSLQKVCISRNGNVGKNTVHIIASAGMPMSMNTITCISSHCYSAGMATRLTFPFVKTT